jgi:nucleotide-binding universal stress UspA family protein
VSAGDPAARAGCALIAFDGSELATEAINDAGALLGPGREALVVCVWQPYDVGFVPVTDIAFDAKKVTDVRAAAERTAAAGAGRAEAVGFRARSIAVEASPTWKGIVQTADEHDAAVIVLGSHGRTGLTGILVGSVAAAVAAHAQRSVLISHHRAGSAD